MASKSFCASPGPVLYTDLAMLDVPSYVGNDYFCDTGVPTGQAMAVAQIAS